MRVLILVLCLIVLCAVIAIAQSDAGFLNGPGNSCWWGYWTGNYWGDGTFVPLQYYPTCPG